MNTLEIPSKDIKIEIPFHWDEMRPDEILFCLREGLGVTAGTQSELAAKVKCLYKLADIKRTWRTIVWERIVSQDRVDQKNANTYQLADQLITFLFKPLPASVAGSLSNTSESPLELNYDTIFNHFPEIKVRLKTFIGPGDLLSDLTFSEFRCAIDEMNEFFTEKSEHALSRMIACLYRPERKNYEAIRDQDDFDGNRRRPFNTHLIEQDACIIDKMDAIHRIAILLWFTYTIDYIQSRDLILSGREVNLSPLFPKPNTEHSEGSASKASGSGWTSLLYSIAKEGVFGNANETDKSGLFDILLYMYDQHLQSKKLKKKP